MTEENNKIMCVCGRWLKKNDKVCPDCGTEVNTLLEGSHDSNNDIEQRVLKKFYEVYNNSYPYQASTKPEINTWEDLIADMARLTKINEDDIGSAIILLKGSGYFWYKDCFIHGKYEPKAEVKEEVAEEIKQYNPESTREMTLAELQDILGLTIKHDNANKIITFLTMIDTYTEDSQSNIAYRSISSTGKSYIPIEEAQYFPKEDVISIAYASPTSFWHDNSEWDEEEQVLKMDMERKIYIFIDQPHDMLLQRLRPVLSHDKKELDIKITDRKEKYGIRTKTVRIRGYPTVIFCSGSLKMNEQESTRSFLLSPETTQEKLKDSIELKIRKDSNTMQFADWINSDKRRLLLKERIEQIKEAKIRYVILDEEKIKQRFFKDRKFLKPRDTRDIGRLDNLIKAMALLNLWYREKDKDGNLIASDKDYDDGFAIWDDIAESQELGIPPYIYRIFKEVIEPLLDNGSGITRKDISKAHYQKYGRPLADWQLRQEIIPSLESVGLIFQEPNPTDKREMLICSSSIDNHSATHCIISNDDGLKKYSELESGVSNIVSGDVVENKASLKPDKVFGNEQS